MELGAGTSEVTIGGAVVGWSERRSSHAEYVIVPEDHLVPKPDALSWEVAGSLFIAGLTAFAAARNHEWLTSVGVSPVGYVAPTLASPRTQKP